MEPEELADALKRLAAWAEQHAPTPESAVRRRLHDHLGRDPGDLPIVSRALAAWDWPNFQVAVDAWTAGREVEVVGLSVIEGYRAGLAELVRERTGDSSSSWGAVRADVTVPLGEHESIACIEAGLWLLHDDGAPLVLMLKSQEGERGESLGLEVMVADPAHGERVLADLFELMRERNVYRGRTLELRPRHFHDDEGAPLTVRSLPSISRDRIVLPPGVLERIERQAFGIAEQACG